MTTQRAIYFLETWAANLHDSEDELSGEIKAITARLKALEDALLPFAAITPSSLYSDDDGSSIYDPGYVVVLCEDHQRPDFSRDDLNNARAILNTVREAEE